MPYLKDGTFFWYAATLTSVLHYFASIGINSREDFLNRFDVDATPKQFELAKGIGPAKAELIVHLRGMSIDRWREVTGLPAFNSERRTDVHPAVMGPESVPIEQPADY